MNIKIDDLSINYEVSDISVGHYGYSATQFSINIQFKRSDKKRMSTKVLNEIKKDTNFQKFFQDIIEQAIVNNYADIVSTTPSGFTNFQHKLEVWLTGNKLRISNTIITHNTIDELKADMQYLINGFFNNKASRTVFWKVNGMYQKV